MLDQEPLLQQSFPAGLSGSRMVQRPQQGLCFCILVAPILKALLYSLPLLSCLLDSPPATLLMTPSTLPFFSLSVSTNSLFLFSTSTYSLNQRFSNFTAH